MLKSRPTCGCSVEAQSAEARVVRGQSRRVFRKQYKHQSEIMYQAVSVCGIKRLLIVVRGPGPWPHSSWLEYEHHSRAALSDVVF